MTNRIEEMRAQIHATPMAPAPTKARWRHRRRIRLVSGGAVGLALAAAAGIVVFAIGDGSDPSPAFAAVTHLWHGQPVVTITLREEQDIPKLNAKLKAEHVPVRVVPITRGCHSPVRQVGPHWKVLPGPAKTMPAFAEYYGREQLYISQITIGTDLRGPGRTYILPDSKTGLIQGGGGIVVGKIPTCARLGPRENMTDTKHYAPR